MDSISSASRGIDYANQILATTTQRVSEGNVTPEVVSAGEIAQQLLEVQTNILKESLQVQAGQILNLIA
jgi:hypothetical protein